MRTSGVLLPVFSLPGPYGIGCFSKEAYEFIDFLKEAGQSWWQILPLTPTGYGDSPYQAFSTFAGNPYFIDPAELVRQGLLTEAECAKTEPHSASRVDYGWLYQVRWKLLRKAFSRSDALTTPAYAAFENENSFWLSDYALFMAIKDAHGGRSLVEWETELQTRESTALAAWEEKLSEDVAFYKFLQFEFDREWRQLKDYAASKGVGIIGDIPIYVSGDSADFWANNNLFKVDERGRIRQVAGVPPDGFSATGQVWGNPLYDWPAHARTGYDWWIRRMDRCRQLYDIIRLDHFRGFDEYFAIPAGADTAAEGVWERGPGMDLFSVFLEKWPDIRIIAEDLGYVTESVRQLVRDTGFPNMKVLEFAFDSRDSTGRWEYMPYNLKPNSAIYTGTHDNETLAGWLDSILPAERAEVKEFFLSPTGETEDLVDRMVAAAQGSVSDTCIIPLQDWLRLNNTARINQPSTFGSNWQWRTRREDLDEDLRNRMKRMATLYGRERSL